MANEHDLSTKPGAASEQPGTSAGVITVNVGGRKFVTLESTLTTQSTYFKTLLSDRWAGSALRVDGSLFVDANPALFEHILHFLRRSTPPVFWTRNNGFDYALYTALQCEAEYFGIETLARWIAEQKYLGSIAISQSIEQVDLSHCLNKRQYGSTRFSDNSETSFDPNEYSSKNGGVKYKRIYVRATKFQAPETL